MITKVKKGDRVQAKSTKLWGTVTHIAPPTNDYPAGYFLVSWDDKVFMNEAVKWYEREIGPVLLINPPAAPVRSTILSPVCTQCQTVYPDANHTENFICWSCRKYPFYK